MYGICYSVNGGKTRIGCPRFRTRVAALSALYHDQQLAKACGCELVAKVVWAGY